MSDRAVSTVLDVSICLLLVSAAVLTLAGVPAPTADPAAGAAAETAALLGSTTATVNYSLAADVRQIDGEPAFPVLADPAFDRSANATLAELLAAAAMANLSVAGERVSPLGDDFGTAVRNATRPLLAGPGWEGQVVVRWRPYRDAHLVGGLVVGPSPPPGVDVYAARLQVSNGISPIRDAGDVAARNGNRDFRNVADVVAERIVEGLFPPEQLRPRLLGPYPEAQLTALRYTRFGARYGVPLDEAVEQLEIARANGMLRDAVADAVEADLRETFETPSAAADAVNLGTVTVTVRTWSP